MDRRVRTAWMLRKRYRRLAWYAAVVGGLGAVAIIALVMDEIGSAAVLTSPKHLVGSALALASCVLVPRWAVAAIGRRHSRRHE